MNDEAFRAAVATLENIKPDSTIALAIDKANEKADSICRIAIAWISGDEIYGISRLVKPPTHDFSASRKITEAMVANRDSFDIVWDRDIQPLLKTNRLSAYAAMSLFKSIKASYEASGRHFIYPEYFVCDLLFLASAYIQDLGNESLVSIARKLGLSVDLDNALSRAMACVRSVDILNEFYSINNYYTPLFLLLRGSYEEIEKHWDSQAQPSNSYSHKGLSLFAFFCLAAFGYFSYVQNEIAQNNMNVPVFSSDQSSTLPAYDKNRTYHMSRGTYILTDIDNVDEFLAVAKNRDMEAIRKMVQSGRVLVFPSFTAIKITGDPDGNGFVPVTVADGESAGASGYAPYTMIVR